MVGQSSIDHGRATLQNREDEFLAAFPNHLLDCPGTLSRLRLSCSPGPSNSAETKKGNPAGAYRCGHPNSGTDNSKRAYRSGTENDLQSMLWHNRDVPRG